MSWDTARLGDVCTKIGSGATPKGGSTVYIENGTSFIRSQNVYNLKFDYDGLTYINEDAAKKLNGVTIYKNDILLNITGDSVARTCIVPEEIIPARVNQHVAIIRPDSEKLNPHFLNYYLASPYMQSFMLGLAVGKGASRNAMTKDMIANFQVPCPPIETQKNIVDILHPYDSLIENNQKQIKLLEEAAQRLYKEWFVDLRVPGYETTPVVDGVPEGWISIPLENSILYEIGGGWGEETPTAKCDKEGFVVRGTDFYGITHGNYNVPFRYHSMSNLTSRILVDGDIIFEVSGGSKTEGVARSAYITQKMIDRWHKPVMCASFCKLIRPKDNSISLYLFNHLQHLRSCGKTTEYDKRSASSIVNYRWKDFLSQEYILIPSEEVLMTYNAFAKALQDSIVNCSLKIEKASISRDRLLPKLMNGEIEV